MKQLYFALLLATLQLCSILSLEAQTNNWPQRFFIGANHVRCDLPSGNLNTWPAYIQGVEGVTDNYGAWNADLLLPQDRIDQLEALGIDLAMITIEPAHLDSTQIPSPPPGFAHNVVSDLNRAMRWRATPGAEPIDLMIEDLPLQQAVSAERLMFHPEHLGDFSNDGGYDGVSADEFLNHPFIGLKIDRQLGLSQQTSSPNCLLLIAPGTISGLTRLRKAELSVHRPYEPTSDTTAGKYHVSIVMRANSTVTASGSNPALRVRLHSLPNTVTMEIPASAFYDGSNGLITDRAIEYYLGEVELRQDTQGGEPYWIDWRGRVFPISAADSGRFNPPSIPSADIEAGMFDDIDISLEYLSGTTGDIYIDAICLSSPAGYALFLHDSSQVHPVFRFKYGDFDSRLHHVLFDINDDLHERLRLIYGREQDWNSGAWRATKLASLELKTATSGGVRMYSTTSAWSNPDRTTELMDLNLDAASGYYHYPIHWNLPMPREPQQDYYPRLILLPDSANLQFTTERYRGFATARKEWGTHAPWIPIVQNHSNIFDYDPPQYDDDPLREPTAAEVRVQCNLALAYGANGIMFSQFSQVPIEVAAGDTAYWPWPQDRAIWQQNQARRNDNVGSIGFLNGDNSARTVDTHGENKWDSTIVTIAKTRTLGQFMIDEGLRWQWGKSWYWQRPGASDLVTNVVSRRLNNVNPVDPATETLVQTTEFKAPDGTDYIFVLNCRTDSLGHRDITVKLNTKATDWIVENVLTRDVWLVRPTSTPDPTSDAHGFTEYFAPGAGALYRVQRKAVNAILDTCFAHTFTVTPGAVLSMDAAAIRLTPAGALVIEDSTTFSNCAIECCDVEGHANIYVRNGGALNLVGTTLSPSMSTVSRVPISVGPLSRFTSTRTIYAGIPGNDAALSVVDGHAFTLENAIDLSGGGTFINMLGGGELLSRRDSVQGNTAFFSYGINALGGRSFIEGTRLLNLGIPLVAQSGSLIQGCDTSSPVIGRNKIRANTMAMYCQNSEIFFGKRPWGTPGNWYASQNSIGVLNPTSWYHASAPSGYIYAHANYWGYGSGTPLQACAANVYGNVDTNYALTSDLVPFTGGTGGELSKSTFSAAAPPAGIRETVLGYLAANAHADARSAMASFLQNGGGATASVQDLAFLHRMARQVDGQSLVAVILSVLDNRQDLRSKLLAADILEEENDIAGALSVLNSYSFAGSDTLLRDALLRKAILHPQAGAGGYAHGVAVLDTLATLVAFDSTLAGFIERYPRLMSNLSRRGTTATPKSTESSRFRQALPDGIDVWPNYPNPFSDVTSFTFKIGEDRHVRLAVYDAMGREVAVVTDADYSRGVHSAVLRSSGLPSGLYFYRLTTDAGVIQRKMLLMR